MKKVNLSTVKAAFENRELFQCNNSMHSARMSANEIKRGYFELLPDEMDSLNDFLGPFDSNNPWFYTVYSYGTPVIIVSPTGSMWVSPYGYSPTTTRHISACGQGYKITRSGGNRF